MDFIVNHFGAFVCYAVHGLYGSAFTTYHTHYVLVCAFEGIVWKIVDRFLYAHYMSKFTFFVLVFTFDDASKHYYISFRCLSKIYTFTSPI